MFETVNQQFKAIQELERRHFRWLSLPPINVDTNVCLVAANVGSLRNCGLPGQKCRGLIEATIRATRTLGKTDLPRQKCRGLIEELKWSQRPFGTILVFPGRHAGASLKLEARQRKPSKRRKSSPGRNAGASLKRHELRPHSAGHRRIFPGKMPGPH